MTDPFDEGMPVRIMETGPDARPDDGPTVAVAEFTHFRRTGTDTVCLYHEGDHLPAGHRDLEAIPAELVNGAWVPAEPTRKAGKR